LSGKGSVTWYADPHTIAKIELIRRYLNAWFPIVGLTFSPKPILYVDGFAGPGEYTNPHVGSPVVALEAAIEAAESEKLKGRHLNVLLEFVEQDSSRVENLQRFLNGIRVPNGVSWDVRCGEFDRLLPTIMQEHPRSFTNGYPVFAFVDPFGLTAVPFASISDIMKSSTSEVLINLDADGIARINSYRVGGNVTALNRIFGSSEWQGHLHPDLGFQDSCREILRIYRRRLHQLPGVAYTFPFEMRDKQDKLNYYLLFATGHERGMQKMKQAMRSVGQLGSFSFSDAWTGQMPLFSHETPAKFADHMVDHFGRGTRVTWKTANDFALNETPFDNPRKMLRLLDKSGRLSVQSTSSNRRIGDFPDGKIISVTFR